MARRPHHLDQRADHERPAGRAHRPAGRLQGRHADASTSRWPRRIPTSTGRSSAATTLGCGRGAARGLRAVRRDAARGSGGASPAVVSAAYATGLPAVIRGEEAFLAARRAEAHAGAARRRDPAGLPGRRRLGQRGAPGDALGRPAAHRRILRAHPARPALGDAVRRTRRPRARSPSGCTACRNGRLLILETANMAALATLMGAAAALLLAFPAARNIAPARPRLPGRRAASSKRCAPCPRSSTR